jgi:hypothetical protein
MPASLESVMFTAVHAPNKWKGAALIRTMLSERACVVTAHFAAAVPWIDN